MTSAASPRPVFRPVPAPLPRARASSWLLRAGQRLAAALSVLALAGGATLGLGGAAALAQETDPPGRVARLSLAEGGVRVAEGGEEGGGTTVSTQPSWSAAEPNRPLTGGDRLWTEPGARAEVHVGSNALRLDGQTSLDIAQLDDQTARLRLTQGRLSLRVRQLWDGERIEIGTPHLAVVVNQPGLYRVETDPALGVTRVTVSSGAATLYGENGESRTLQAAQQMAFAGRNLAPVQGQDVARQDTFERWVAERDRLEDQSVAARYVSRETIGYQQLDSYGDWQEDPAYGTVWYPRVTVANWAPYRFGQWRWIAPWGWTWVDDAPWGFAPFHYGRWAFVGSRWGWVPGPRGPRPVYAPALVGFVGGAPGHGPHWNLGADRPGVGWFPLGPGEAWRPGFRASPRYLANVNRHPQQVAVPIGRDRFMFQHRPDAVTAVTQADFERGRPVRNHWQRVGEAELAGTRPMAPPGRGVGPGGYGTRFSDRGVEAREPRGPSAPAGAIGAPLAGSPTQPGVQAAVPGQAPNGVELRPRPPHGAWPGGPRERAPTSAQQEQQWRERDQADRERFRREHQQRDQFQREQMENAQRQQHQQQHQQQQQQHQAQQERMQREQAEQQRRQQNQQAEFQRAQAERQQREQQELGWRQQQQLQAQRAQAERQQQEQMQRQQQFQQQQQAQREQFQRERQQREQEARSRGQVMAVEPPRGGPGGQDQRRAERERNQSIQRGEGYRGQGS